MSLRRILRVNQIASRLVAPPNVDFTPSLSRARISSLQQAALSISAPSLRHLPPFVVHSPALSSGGSGLSRPPSRTWFSASSPSKPHAKAHKKTDAGSSAAQSSTAEVPPATEHAPEQPQQQQHQQPEQRHTHPEFSGSSVSPSEGLRIHELENQIVDLESKIAELQDSLEEWKNAAKSYAAEADNARKIARQDVEAARNYSVSKFSKDLLEVYDVLLKAMEVGQKQHLDTKEDSKAFFEGIAATLGVLQSVFRRHHITGQEIKPGETLFDPNQHDALSLVPDPTKPHNTILQVFSEGFVIHDRVLRAAKVIVSENQEDLKRQQEKRLAAAGNGQGSNGNQ